MSTLKDKLVSGVSRIGQIPQKIASWSQKTQIIVAAGTAGALMVASIGGVAIYQHNSAETVAEADTDTEEVAMATEVDIPEVSVATEIVDIPTFVACTVSGDSIEKDLTLYIKGADNKKIEGEQFEVKLIDPDDKEQLEDALAAIDAINEQLANLNGDAGEEATDEETTVSGSEDESSVNSTTGSGTLTLTTGEETEEPTEAVEESVYISSITGLEVTEEEELLCAKEQAIQEYANVLSSLEGDTYTDSDSDGMIYIESITDGDYIACLIPAAYYDAESYAVKVKVKDKIEYQAVENIEDKTVSEAQAGDVEETHEDVVVEETLTDTVEWVDSKIVPGETIYKSTKAAALVASADTATNDASATNKDASTDNSDSENTGSESESGTGSESESTSESQSQSGTENESQNESGGESQSESQTTRAAFSYTAAKRFSMLRGYMLLATAADNTSAAVKESKLSIPATATLYSDVSGADVVTITVNSSEVSELSVSSGSDSVTVTDNGDGTYKLTAKAGITSDTSTTVTATATAKADGSKLSVSCSVTIKGSSNPLTDSAGHKLFLDASGKTAATYKDYNSSTTYYYQSEETESTYYGWQTIGTSRYYFDKDGNKVTGAQVIMGNKYNFGSDGELLTSGYGIDVSKWQGSIDWAQASSAVSFAIIRAGFRGSNGGISVDSYAGTNIKNAKANGVKVGLYFYSRAVNEVQAVEEASLAISVAKQYGGISLPIYIDMEADNQKSLSIAQRDAIVLAFCTTVKNAGYQAGVYANKNWLTNYLTPSSYTGYSIWCAQYNTSCTYGGRYDIWQYSSKGSIPGISGNVDLDQSFF